jgi:selenide,water dikinase
MGPAALAQVLRSVTMPASSDVLVGLGVPDDAVVYRLSDELALVQTMDFFPPIVDDPYIYGAVAAANALSDVYAMGGRPVLALAIAAFPEDLPPAVIAAILQGGADKAAEAGVSVAGGHTVVDKEPKYGLCVTGLIHPAQVTTKAGARPGDLLLLTKPVGTGAITTAHKRGVVAEDHLAAAIASMLRLNRRAAELAVALGVRCATDITGFGLLGHAAEVAKSSDVGLRISAGRVPLLSGALEYARSGVLPGGLGRNREHLLDEGLVQIEAGLDEALAHLLFDPQTSGGLLLALPQAEAARFRQGMAEAGEACWEIGEVVEGAGIEVTF